MMRELTKNEMEEISGGVNCGYSALVGAAWGLRVGGLWGAAAGAAIGGGFCLAGVALA